MVSQSAEPLAWGTPSLQDISGLWKTRESLHLEAFYKGITELWLRFSSSLGPPPSEEKGLNENEAGQ